MSTPSRVTNIPLPDPNSTPTTATFGQRPPDRPGPLTGNDRRAAQGWNVNNPGAPYTQAANAMNGLAGAAYGYGDDLRNYYQQGTAGAMGYYGAPQSFNNNYGSRYLDPTRGSQAYDAASAYGQKPGQAENYYGQTQAAYTSPTNLSANYGDNAYKFNENPLQSQFGDLSQRMGNSTLSRDLPTYQYQLSGPTNLESNMSGLQSAYNYNPVGQNIGGYQSQIQQAADQANTSQNSAERRISGATQTQQEYGGIKGLVNSNDYSRQLYGQQQSQLGRPGQFEQFAAQAAAGPQYDPTYQRESQLGRDSINAEMNARGAYNSGAALKGLGNFEGDLRAKQYAQVAGLTQQAQQMQQGRLAQQMQGAGQAAGEQQQQAGGLQSLAGQTQQENLGAAMGQSNIATARQQGDLSAHNALLGMDQAASAENRANAQGKQGLYSQADQQRYQNTMGGANLGIQGDQADLARTQGMANLANMTSGQNLAYLQGGLNAANTTDQSSLARLMAGQGAAQGADQGALARMGLMGQMGNQADAGELARLQGYYGNLSGLAGQQAGTSMAGLGAGGDAMMQMMQGGLGLQGQAANMQFQAAMAQYMQKQKSQQDFMNMIYGMPGMAMKFASA